MQLTDVTLASPNSAKFTGKHLSRSSFFGKIADIGKPDTSGLIPLITNRDHSFCTFSKNLHFLPLLYRHVHKMVKHAQTIRRLASNAECSDCLIIAFPGVLVIFTGEILNGKPHFLCSESFRLRSSSFWEIK